MHQKLGTRHKIFSGLTVADTYPKSSILHSIYITVSMKLFSGVRTAEVPNIAILGINPKSALMKLFKKKEFLRGVNDIACPEAVRYRMRLTSVELNLSSRDNAVLLMKRRTK